MTEKTLRKVIDLTHKTSTDGKGLLSKSLKPIPKVLEIPMLYF